MIIFVSSVFLIPAMFSFKIGSILFSPRLSASHQGDMITFVPYLMTQLRVFVMFLKLFFVPIGLNLDYDFPLSYSFFHWEVMGSAAILGGLIVLAIKLREKQPLISLGIAWFFIVLLVNFVPRANIIFEHKMLDVFY